MVTAIMRILLRINTDLRRLISIKDFIFVNQDKTIGLYMANLSKIKRDEMIAFLERLKETHSDDNSIRAFNEIENHIRDKKYGLVWEEHSEEVDEQLIKKIPVFVADKERRLCKDSLLPWNFVIEGDNLQALYLLAKTQRHQVDLIYIDPPYNSGAKDWKYNNSYVETTDEYRHSKWLSMMFVRLKLAKQLLNPNDSVLVITIDEKEYLHIGCMLEELFPDAKIQMVSDVINPRGATRDGQFSRSDEYLFFVQIGENSVVYPKKQNKHYVEWYRLRRTDFDSRRGTIKGGTQQFYPIYIDIQTEKIVKIGDPLLPDQDRFMVPELPGAIPVFPIKNDGTEMNWGVTPDTLKLLIDHHFVRVRKNKGDKYQPYLIHYISYKQIEAIEKGNATIEGYNPDGTAIVVEEEGHVIRPGSAWNIPLHNAGTYGSEILATLIGDKRFNFPKSIYSVTDVLRYFLKYKPNAQIVDFFAGSGTTMHATLLLNAEDNGTRHCICCTNNEVSFAEEEKLKKRGFKKGDDEWERLGIARYVTWPRIFNTINGKNKDGVEFDGEYQTALTEYVKKKRTFKQISFIDINQLSSNELKDAIKEITKGLIQSKLIKFDGEKPLDYITPDSEKATTSILINDQSADEWISSLTGRSNITNYIVITKDKKLFSKIKSLINEEFGDILTPVPVTIPMSAGFKANVKYYKCDWTPRKPEDRLLSNVLCLHIREMIELQNAIEVDNVKNVLILNKTDLYNTVLNEEVRPFIENIWVNQNIIFSSDEIKALKQIGYKYIPREFFGQELKEAAE